SLARMVWFVWRFARFDFRMRSSATHAMLLFDGGRTGRAHREFLEVADSLLETAKSYRKQAALKRQEAINALIFAGRVAALDKDSAATIDAFRRVIEIRDGDYDARKFIGQQFREVGNLSAALREFKELNGLTAAKRDKALAAEAFRLQAEVHTDGGDTAAACSAIEKSVEIEMARRNVTGIALCHELLGDAHKRAGALADAAAAYQASLENYQTIDDRENIQRVHSKIWHLQPQETFLSRTVAAFATFLMERVAKNLRAPAPMP